jgi:hypothetical protein
MLALKNAQAKEGDDKTAKSSVWERLFGSDKRQKEATSEKPALS